MSHPNHLDMMAASLCESRLPNESDDCFRDRLRDKFTRFRFSGSLFDLVHVAETALLRELPVGFDRTDINRRVAIAMLQKNRPHKLWHRIKLMIQVAVSLL